MIATFIVALLSGLIGACVSAYLSYAVRLRAKRQEDAEERQRLAHVNFPILTDTMASDHFITDFLSRHPSVKNQKEEGYDISHQTAAWLAVRISEMKPDELSDIQALIKPIIGSAVTALDRFDIGQSDLGRMAEVTIYAYHRYCAASAHLKASMIFFEAMIEKENVNLLDATALHAMFRTYRTFADSAGVLRASLAQSAGLSSEYSLRCLVRSFTAVKVDVGKTFEHNGKLVLAKAAEATVSPTAG